MKVLFTNGESYIVGFDGAFYLINLTLEGPPLKKKDVGSFLKFGYWEDVESVPTELEKTLKKRLDNI